MVREPGDKSVAGKGFHVRTDQSHRINCGDAVGNKSMHIGGRKHQRVLNRKLDLKVKPPKILY